MEEDLDKEVGETA